MNRRPTVMALFTIACAAFTIWCTTQQHTAAAVVSFTATITGAATFGRDYAICRWNITPDRTTTGASHRNGAPK